MSSIQQGRLRIIFGATAENLSRQIEAVLHVDGWQRVVAVDDLQRYADAVTLLSVQVRIERGRGAHKPGSG